MSNNARSLHARGCLLEAMIALAIAATASPARANPAGGTVVQGNASFNSQGSQFTIQTSDRAQINWSSFNIGVGETTTFAQPSANSVVWNQINDANPSQILGNLNANGYVVLQNSAGFYIGGQAAITAHGILMTTSATPAPNLASGGAWQFNAPPPTASIINYGQITTDGTPGSSAFLIAADVQNKIDTQNGYIGTISAPQGNIGLYAGKQVLVSMRPDGRGLSAKVTLPQGSVDNEGKLIADAGFIAMNAQTVNQGGLVQANSVRQANGVIELLASDTLTLGATSVLSAQADATSTDPSPGGFVVVKSGQTFADSATSSINIAGKPVTGQAGGRDGLAEVFGSGVTKSTILSQIDGLSATAFSAANGLLLINPQNVTLSVSPSTPSASSPNLKLDDLSSFSRIDLFANGNIRLNATWNLLDSPDPGALLTLSSGNSILFGAGTGIAAGNNWNIDFSAGPRGLLARPASGDAISLADGSIQTQNGSINLWAANDVKVSTALSSSSGIRTLNGGSISVTAQYGDVNSGGNNNAFDFSQPSDSAPYYAVLQNLGGISTYAGGNVSITAGRNVTSYLPTQDDYGNAVGDAGSGAFGTQPGNVTITAGGSIAGHYVVVNGAGTVTSTGGDIGAPAGAGGFALSLVKGNWNVYAPAGNIYVQDIRNPNGVFNSAGDVSTSAGYHRFDYDPLTSVLLQAGNMVEITGASAPHLNPTDGVPVPILFPPSLHVNAGPGGFVLNTDVTLFPSTYGELTIFTTGGGNFQSYQDPDPTVQNLQHTLAMSASGAVQWSPGSVFGSFGLKDNAAPAPERDNPNHVVLSISGSIENVSLRTTKATDILVAQDAFNFNFLGENLHTADGTAIMVAGNISYSPLYAFTTVSTPIKSANPILNSAWDSIFSLLVDPNSILRLTPDQLKMTPQQLTALAFGQQVHGQQVHVRISLTGRDLAPGYDPNANPGFIYDSRSGKLGYKNQMSSIVFDALNHTAIPILKLDAQGNVVIERHADGNYYFATTTASFVAPSTLAQLDAQSQNSTSGNNGNLYSTGFQIGGPGRFTINAGSIDMGSSLGFVSWGMSSYGKSPIDYSFLAPLTASGAEINVNSSGDISLLTSAIASIQGGNVNVNSGGAIHLSQGDFALIPTRGDMSFGIFTSGHSDINVTAENDIDVGGARIATFNGGNVFVRSENGNVNAGNGANSVLVVPVVYHDASGRLLTGDIGGHSAGDPRPYGSGIMALSPSDLYKAPGASGLPGNITVETPRGNIVSTLGGIQQFAENGNVAGGPTITLSAGTPASAGSPGYKGNVDLGQGGVFGGTINITAQGNVSGLIVSRQNANINAAQSFSGTLLSGGIANVNATAGTISGTVIGIGGVNASGGAGVTAAVLGQNVSIGGAAATSTLGATAAATSTSQAAAQQANSDAQQQLARNTTQGDDEERKRTQPKAPTLVKRVGRVTVILPKG